MLGFRLVQFPLLVAATMLFTTCAAFRSGDLTLDPWPPKVKDAKRSVQVSIQGVFGPLLESFYKQTIAAYQDSGLFSKILTGSRTERPDIVADISVFHRGEGSRALATLSGLTLLLIPATAQDSFEVRTRFQRDGGELLGTTSQSQSVRAWFHITMIFLWPFMPLQAQMDATMRDLARASLVEAAQAGIFDK